MSLLRCLLLGFKVCFPFVVGKDNLVLLDLEQDGCARVGRRAGLVGHESSLNCCAPRSNTLVLTMLAARNHQGVAPPSPVRPPQT